MDLTYGLLLLILGGIVGILGVLVPKQKKTRKTLGWIGFIALGIGVISLFTTIPYLANVLPLALAPAGPTPPPTPSNQVGEVCAVEDTTVTLSGQDEYTSVATGGTHRYRINGNPALTVSDAGTLTASPGDQLQILFGNETASTYFRQSLTETVPCLGTKTFSANLLKNGTVTITIFNEDTVKIDANNNETLGANDKVDLDITIKSASKTGFPYGGILVVDYNKTLYDKIVIDLGGSSASVPTFFGSLVASQGLLATGGDEQVAYSVPAFKDNEKLEGTVSIEVSAIDPTALNVSEIEIIFYANNLFINEDNGGAYEGPSVEDEDNSATFGHETISTLYVK